MMNAEDRFWAKVEKGNDGCWIWTGGKSKNGYGFFMVSKNPPKTMSAHKFSYLIVNASVTAGYEIDHACGNRLCVNPSHMRIATRSQNNANQKISSRNTSGFKGVSWSKKDKRWAAHIMHKRKSYFLGNFLTPEEAHDAYNSAAEKMFGEFHLSSTREKPR